MCININYFIHSLVWKQDAEGRAFLLIFSSAPLQRKTSAGKSGNTLFSQISFSAI